MTAPIYSFTAQSLDGKEIGLDHFAGQVMLIVNTASQCGFTPQYAGLEALYQKFHDRGLVVLGFPCNQFGHQEPGTAAEIGAFCQKNFGVTFPLFAKIDVNGDNTHPLYGYLKAQAKGLMGSEAIKWNFTKFLVDREGKVIRRYAPATTPESITEDIEGLFA